MDICVDDHMSLSCCSAPTRQIWRVALPERSLALAASSPT